MRRKKGRQCKCGKFEFSFSDSNSFFITPLNSVVEKPCHESRTQVRCNEAHRHQSPSRKNVVSDMIKACSFGPRLGHKPTLVVSTSPSRRLCLFVLQLRYPWVGVCVYMKPELTYQVLPRTAVRVYSRQYQCKHQACLIIFTQHQQQQYHQPAAPAPAYWYLLYEVAAAYHPLLRHEFDIRKKNVFLV